MTTPERRRRWLDAAVLVPLLGLSILVVRAEVTKRSGDTWRIPIEGFDPRDLLHGRYLRFRYAPDWVGPHTCGPTTPRDPVADCCLCLTRTNARGVDPRVRQVDCSETDRCDGWLDAGAMEPPRRYFVPEDRAHDLEAALRDRDAAMELTSGPEGIPAISELYIDGRPWRDAVRE